MVTLAVTAPPLHLVANRYCLLKKIGQGGMGAVYRAEDRLYRTIVALKRVELPFQFGAALPKDDSAYATHLLTNGKTNAQAALVNEFRVLASLRHPNIVSVLDYGLEDDGTPFFTMELLENPVTLVRAAARCDLVGKIKLLIELLQALVYLHRHNIIHHDLKPSNVLVDQAGHVRVVDFGLALRPQLAARKAGTLGYMAPEVIAEGMATEATDLYSFGVIAYECLSGDRPFGMRNTGQLRRDILKKAPKLRQLEQEVGAPLAGLIGRLLGKDPTQRPSDAKAVILDLCNAVQLTPPQETSDIRNSFLQTAPLIGRLDELAILERALNDASRGSGSVWLLAGESGVGKSRLMDELRIRAMLHGLHVLRGHGVEGGAAAFHLWHEVLAALLLMVEVNDQEASILKAIIPTIHEILERPIPDPLPLEPQTQRDRLLTTITTVVARQTRPLLILLDDLQWASADLPVLSALLNVIGTLPILIVGSFRREESPHLHEQIGAQTQVLRLKRLQSKEVGQLCEAILGKVGSSKTLQTFLTRETQGNAQFLIEVLRLLADDVGQLEHIGQKNLPDRVMPFSMSKLIWRRLTRLSAGDRLLLNLAAVYGQYIDLRLFSVDYAIKDVAEWVSRCVDVAILAVTEGRCHFENDKVRDAVLRNIPQTVLPHLHAELARAIEAVYPADLTRAAELAGHWQQAGHLDRAIPYWLHEAERLIRLNEMDWAQTLLKSILAQAAAAAYEVPPSSLARIYYLIAISIDDLTSDHSAASHAATWYQMSLASAETIPDRLIYADTAVKLGRLLIFSTGDYDQARALLDAAHAIYTHTDHSRGLAEAHLGYGELARILIDLDSAISHYRMARQYYERCQYSPGSIMALTKMAAVCMALGRIDESMLYATEALALGEVFQDRQGIVSALFVLGGLYRCQGELQHALDCYERALPIAEQIGQPRMVAGIWLNRGFVWYHNQALARATYAFREAITLAQRADDERMVAWGFAGLASVEIEQRQLRDARQSLFRWLNVAQRFGIRTLPHGMIALSQLAIRENQLVLAAEWLGMVFALRHQPLSDSAAPVLETLSHVMEPDALLAALERGRAQPLDDDIERITQFVTHKLSIAY
jgi:serine/threonine protein kinase/tetratricopeptide (TPR) repeat protein